MRVTYCESIGTESYVYGTVGGSGAAEVETILHLPDHARYEAGAELTIVPHFDRAHLFDVATGLALVTRFAPARAPTHG